MKNKKRRRRLDWRHILWAASQLYIVWFVIDITSFAVNLYRDAMYSPSDRSVMFLSLGLIAYLLINPTDPISYLREWIWLRNCNDAEYIEAMEILRRDDL